MNQIYKIASLNDLLLIDKSKPIAVDTETAKQYKNVVLLQLYQLHWDKVLLFDSSNLLQVWKKLCNYTLIFHNAIYDFYSIKADLGDDFTMPLNWEDTFYLSRLTFPQWQKYSLDNCLKNCLGFDPYNALNLNKKELQVSFLNTANNIHQRQYTYAALDVYYLLHLYNSLKHNINLSTYKLDKFTVMSIIKDEKGMPVDINRLNNLVAADNEALNQINKELPQNLNVNSYVQLRNLLGTICGSDTFILSMIINRPNGLENLKYNVKQVNGKYAKAVLDGLLNKDVKGYKYEFGKFTPLTDNEIANGCASLPKETRLYIKEIKYKHSEQIVNYAKLIMQKKKILKRLNFAKRAKDVMRQDADNIYRIAAHYSPHAINGRIQVDNENLSQYPRSMKEMWGFSNNIKRKLIYSDFSQIELRIICGALPETNMYKSLSNGVDLHSFVSERLNIDSDTLKALPYGLNARFLAKQCNFLLLYGGGNNNFQKVVCKLAGVYFDDELIARITSNWKKIFSDIAKWHHHNALNKDMMDETVLGHKYKAQTITDLNNIRISGTGAEIFKLWLHYINKYNIPGDDGYIVNRIHDAVILDIPETANYEAISKNLVKAAQKAWFEVMQHAPLKDVPMPCEVVVGRNWADMENKTNIDYEFKLDGTYMLNKSLESELE